MPRSTPTATTIGRTRPTVNYVNVKGRTVDATVVAVGGGANQLHVVVGSLDAGNRLKTNVPKKTAANQVNVWF